MSSKISNGRLTSDCKKVENNAKPSKRNTQQVVSAGVADVFLACLSHFDAGTQIFRPFFVVGRSAVCVIQMMIYQSTNPRTHPRTHQKSQIQFGRIFLTHQQIQIKVWSDIFDPPANSDKSLIGYFWPTNNTQINDLVGYFWPTGGAHDFRYFQISEYPDKWISRVIRPGHGSAEVVPRIPNQWMPASAISDCHHSFVLSARLLKFPASSASFPSSYRGFDCLIQALNCSASVQRTYFDSGGHSPEALSANDGCR